MLVAGRDLNSVARHFLNAAILPVMVESLAIDRQPGHEIRRAFPRTPRRAVLLLRASKIRPIGLNV